MRKIEIHSDHTTKLYKKEETAEKFFKKFVDKLDRKCSGYGVWDNTSYITYYHTDKESWSVIALIDASLQSLVFDFALAGYKVISR